jgi:hypothetical protein
MNERSSSGFVAELNKLKNDWNVLKLRKLSEPFYLGRTKMSMWEDKRMVPADLQFPVPFLEDPEDLKDTDGSHYREALTLLANLDAQKKRSTCRVAIGCMGSKSSTHLSQSGSHQGTHQQTLRLAGRLILPSLRTQTRDERWPGAPSTESGSPLRRRSGLARRRNGKRGD